MSDGLNRWTGLGNLAADPELRVTPGGQAVLNLRVACNHSYLDRNNVRQEQVEFARVSLWGRRAEALGKILQKGAKIYVEGRMHTSSYEKNGEKRYSTEIQASNVIFCGSAAGAPGAPQRESPGREPGRRVAAVRIGRGARRG
jgi:single-strand DNA-binding protein